MIDEKGGTYELTVEKLLPVLDRANRVFVLTSFGMYVRTGRREAPTLYTQTVSTNVCTA